MGGDFYGTEFAVQSLFNYIESWKEGYGVLGRLWMYNIGGGTQLKYPGVLFLGSGEQLCTVWKLDESPFHWK